MKTNEFQQVPVVILCGGLGLRIDETQGRQNKALIEVEGRPLVYWVMQHYALHGAGEFLLATGFQGERFGAALEAAGAGVGADGVYALELAGHACRVRLVPTPLEASTAERLLACRPLLAGAERFALTYSDTLSEADLGAEMRFHQGQQLVATLLGTTYPVRFRILGMRQGESLVRAFAPRPVIEAASINGGFYIFTPALWDERYGVSAGVALENQPLERLAAAGQLAAFESKAAWQHCDAERDLAPLARIAQRLRALAE